MVWLKQGKSINGFNSYIVLEMILLQILFYCAVISGERNCGSLHGYLCCSGQRWDPLTRTCRKCDLGYYGQNCSSKCPYPRYGENCLQICRCNETFCNKGTGCQELFNYTKNRRTELMMTTSALKSQSTLDIFTSSGHQTEVFSQDTEGKERQEQKPMRSAFLFYFVLSLVAIFTILFVAFIANRVINKIKTGNIWFPRQSELQNNSDDKIYCNINDNIIP